MKKKILKARPLGLVMLVILSSLLSNTVMAQRNFLPNQPQASIPYTENFDALTVPAMPAQWATENNDGDAYQWESSANYKRSVPNCLYINYNNTDAMDDWAFSPGLALNEESSYIMSFWYRVTDFQTGKLALHVGTSAASTSMGSALFDATITNEEWEQAIITFTTTSAGSYYLGLHGYSDRNGASIYIDDIEVYEKPQPIYSGSSLNVTPNGALPNQPLTYAVVISNSEEMVGAATLTNAIPDGTSYVAGSASVNPAGYGTLNDSGDIQWSGIVTQSLSVTLTYQVMVDATAGMITNTSVISDPLISSPLTLTLITQINNNFNYLPLSTNNYQ